MFVELLNKEFINLILDNHWNEKLFKATFALEKENTRIDEKGRLALTPHPKAFGKKIENPYIKTDFSESQVEMITPVFDSIDDAYHFLEALHDIVTLDLDGEYLWPSSNPPELPEEEEIPIARMEDPKQYDYRVGLAKKYGRKKQLLSGIHYNFSFDKSFLLEWYEKLGEQKSFKDFKDEIYLKVARNTLKYRWLLIYLTGASPVFHYTFMDKGTSFENGSRSIENMNSLRNSEFGYRNNHISHISFDSIDEYIRDIEKCIQNQELTDAREFYSPVRIKASNSKNYLQDIKENGVDYLELRMLDLNPLYKIGINKEDMYFIHLFLVYMLVKKDEPFDKVEQEIATINHDNLIKNGINEYLTINNSQQKITMQEMGIKMLQEMEDLLQNLYPFNENFLTGLQKAMAKFRDPNLTYAYQIKNDIGISSYIDYHLDKAKQYAEESSKRSYIFKGYEDLELSTQLLLKAAVKRGIEFQLIDREENFISLRKGNKIEYVKQATKTSLDSYITVLIMENKLVTKQVLREKGIRVPNGKHYHDLSDAIYDYEQFQDKVIVIKPKSTNFGLGITIFKHKFSKDDYVKAFELAFQHDKTVLIEEFFSGKEYRFLVMGNEVVGILHRVPANVIGDGVLTIEELVYEKNKDPLRGKGYKTPLEKIELVEETIMFLKNQSMDINYIPNKNEIVFLRENSNISTGGDSIDFTDDIPESYKKIAIECAKAAGATFCGVDMVIDDIYKEADETNYGIIEINFNPAIHIHCYPYKGQNRKADEKILDLLFGEN